MTAKADTKTAKTDYVIEPGKQELTMTRVFDAPRELVFKAFTDPKLVSQWFGPRQYTTTVDKMEARPGGLWRFVQRNQNGDEFAFHGVHHDVVAPERIVATFEFEGVPGHVLLQTVNFEPLGQKTRLVEQWSSSQSPTATEWWRRGCRKAPMIRWTAWTKSCKTSRRNGPESPQHGARLNRAGSPPLSAPALFCARVA